jgi:hypothetical protein
MISFQSGLRATLAHVCMLLVTLLAACGSEPESMGSLSLGLSGQSASGALYRLRNGVVFVAGATGTTTFQTEDDPSRSSLSARLPAGDYHLALSEGWYLERVAMDGTSTRVEAALLSENPQTVTVVAGAVTTGLLRFRAGDDDVTLGNGDVEVRIDVTESAGSGLGPWTGDDAVPASASVPFGLAPSQAPQFVSLGFGGHVYAEAVDWTSNLVASRGGSATFFTTTLYLEQWTLDSPTLLKRALHGARELGHEVGNQTHSHPRGQSFTHAQWLGELTRAEDWLTRPFRADEPDFSPDPMSGVGVAPEALHGLRTPFFEYSDASFDAAKELGIRYDNSIEEGHQPEQDGTNFAWPYTLDTPSPGHELFVSWGVQRPLGAHPGLWELPVYVVIVPPDEVAAEYGIEPGLRAKLRARVGYFDAQTGKIRGNDYDLWASFGLTRAEFVATLSYTLDLRLRGNHAPFLFAATSDYYSDRSALPASVSAAERRAALEEFLDYAQSKPEVELRSYADVLGWVRNPDE